jgi:hypothetical protein
MSHRDYRFFILATEDTVIKITKYKFQITNKLQITMFKITNKKLMKSFCGGVQRGRFFQKEPPLAAGGIN